jgi:hypothetical protein
MKLNKLQKPNSKKQTNHKKKASNSNTVIRFENSYWVK